MNAFFIGRQSLVSLYRDSLRKTISSDLLPMFYIKITGVWFRNSTKHRLSRHDTNEIGRLSRRVGQCTGICSVLADFNRSDRR
jgi:hypothetical protein